MKSPLHSARLLHLRKGEIFSAIGLNSHKRARLIGRCWLAGNQTSGKLDIVSLIIDCIWHFGGTGFIFFSVYIYAKVFARSFVKWEEFSKVNLYFFLEQEKWGRIFLYCDGKSFYSYQCLSQFNFNGKKCDKLLFDSNGNGKDNAIYFIFFQIKRNFLNFRYW